MRFWLSWYEKAEDYRPLTFPPNKAICGWWCTGEGSDGWTLCATVDARNEKSAWSAVRKDWPGAIERFTNVEDEAFTPPQDRFPQSDWMIPRLCSNLTD